MVIYLDILLIENFLVNIFLLTVTMQSMRKKVTLKSLIVSAALGSLYVITVVYPRLNFFSKTPFKIMVALVMNLITVGSIKEWRTVLKASAIYILFSMGIAGVCFYLSIKKGGAFIADAVLYDFSYKKLVLSIMLIYVAALRLIIYIRDRKILETYIYLADIYIDDGKTTIKALLDTGNELLEPVTNLPVMIVEEDVFNNLSVGKKKFYSIPYSSVGSTGASLKGIKADRVIIKSGGSCSEKELIIAFTNTRLSKHGEYRGLLPRGII